MDKLDDTIAKERDTLASRPSGHHERYLALNDLAASLSMRFLEMGQMEDLGEAIMLYREARNLWAPEEPNRIGFLTNFGHIMSMRFLRLRQTEDIDEAITLHREAVDILPPGYRNRAATLVNLANNLLTGFRARRDTPAGDLDEAITLYRRSLSLGYADRSHVFQHLGNALVTRFQRIHHVDDLLGAIQSYREGIVICPPGHADHAIFLRNLNNALFTNFQLRGRTEELDEIIRNTRATLEASPEGHSDRPMFMDSLAATLSTRSQVTGQIEDLQEAIHLHKSALTLRPVGHPDHYLSVINLASSLFTLFQQLGQAEDLEESISLNRHALEVASSDHENRPRALNDLARGLSTRFEHMGRMEELEEAIRYSREAVTLCPVDHPRRSGYIDSLSNNLFLHFQQLGDVSELEEAIAHHEESLALCPPGSPYRSIALGNLARAYTARFDEFGRIDDLNKGIQLQRESVELRPVGHPDRSMSLNNLAVSLSNRFAQLGKMEDLEEEITVHKEALDLRPPGHPNRSMSINNLAAALSIRFKQFGQIEDLERSIALHRGALVMHPPGHPAHSMSLSNIGNGLFDLYLVRPRIEYLNESIQVQQEALALRPPGHLERSSSLNNLASTLALRFKALNNMEDLHETITMHREGLKLRPRGNPDRFTSLDNLAVSITTRCRALGELGGLDEAIGYHEEALELCPPPQRPKILLQFGNTVKFRYEKLRAADDLEYVCHLFEEAVDHRPASSKDRLSVAQQWAAFARREKHESALKAYSMSLVLLERSLVVNPTVELQQQFLNRPSESGHLTSLALDAASWAIEAGTLETAVEMLETGRGLLWSRMRGYRNSIDRLRGVDQALAEEFDSTSAQLETLATSSASHLPLIGSHDKRKANQIQASMEAQWTRQRLLSEKYDSVVDRVRQIAGFEDFLRTMPFSHLRAVAEEGPVIIINISRHRSDAIILFNSTSDPVLVPLSSSIELYDKIAELSSDLSLAREQRDSEVIARTVGVILRTLWDTVVNPITTKLEALGTSKGSRIWWCPTGKLCSLPIHAAQPFRSGPPQTLSQLYVPSYTPTLSSLITARAEIKPRSSLSQVLAVGLPDGQPPLPRVREEIEKVDELGKFVLKLVGADATEEAVLAELKQRSWAHFACHGRLDHAQPLNSSFELHDAAQLTIVDLMKARLPDAEFAFLSACHSAAGDMEGTPDEVIHLAAGMQFCGFRSVVGTLWAMEDVDGPAMAADFYGKMFEKGDPVKVDFRDASKALRAATKNLRRNKATVDRWANFVHIGA
ncbi:hypothetical protein BV25DRAFT_1666502 [Artomyces pyxidatus]|uniref:Uncharacterized protein n=1 Tax=Artomyces pyxidatus TaxID=48021 RepID=A0ACB8SI62_9AGAM|nr:hypothetical protein BV25DRAFT_1666502 [Artomyces pyxidatus]